MNASCDWSEIKHFTKREFECSRTGACRMNREFMLWLDGLRDELGFPLVVTSGYRDPSHPLEAAKKIPGAHAFGLAVDFRLWGANALKLVELATSTSPVPLGLGVAQCGLIEKRFIHLDHAPPECRQRPRVWSYERLE